MWAYLQEGFFFFFFSTPPLFSPPKYETENKENRGVILDAVERNGRPKQLQKTRSHWVGKKRFLPFFHPSLAVI